jgi:hypothetical protein
MDVLLRVGTHIFFLEPTSYLFFIFLLEIRNRSHCHKLVPLQMLLITWVTPNPDLWSCLLMLINVVDFMILISF